MFKLYPRDSATFRFEDYGLLMEEVKRSGAKSALEFGPGNSTLALIESGLIHIVTCEHDKSWRKAAVTKFKDFPQVKVIPYRNDPEAKADIEGEFDIAFVDSPKGYAAARVIHPGQEDCSRFNTCVLALKHSPIVILHDAMRPLERGSLGRLNAMGHKIMFLNSRYGMSRIERDGKNQN